MMIRTHLLPQPLLLSSTNHRDMSSSRRFEKEKKITRTRSDTLGLEPTSPKVTCLGQIKNGKSHPSGDNKPNTKFSKLKRIVSARLCGVAASGGKERFDGSNGFVLVCSEMDPPLPVVKPAAKERCGESLWKRRSGEPLKGLDLNNAGAREF